MNELNTIKKIEKEETISDIINCIDKELKCVQELISDIEQTLDPILKESVEEKQCDKVQLQVKLTDGMWEIFNIIKNIKYSMKDICERVLL